MNSFFIIFIMNVGSETPPVKNHCHRASAGVSLPIMHPELTQCTRAHQPIRTSCDLTLLFSEDFLAFIYSFFERLKVHDLNIYNRKIYDEPRCRSKVTYCCCTCCLSFFIAGKMLFVPYGVFIGCSTLSEIAVRAWCPVLTICPSQCGHSLIHSIPHPSIHSPRCNASGRLGRSPRERLELGEVGPAGFLHLSCTLQRAVPPCGGLRRRPFGVPEVCRPARTWERKRRPRHLETVLVFISENTVAEAPSEPPLCLMGRPASDVFCCGESSSSSSSDPELRSLSLPPFSKLVLELPVEDWDTPNLRARRSDGGGARTPVFNYFAIKNTLKYITNQILVRENKVVSINYS